MFVEKIGGRGLGQLVRPVVQDGAPPPKASVFPVPSFIPSAPDATRVAVAAPPGTNVATLAQSQLAQKIYDQHQKLKVLAKVRMVSADMLKRAQEHAKFLTAYVQTYSPPHGRLRSDVAANLLRVVNETPGLKTGLGLLFVPLVVWGIIIAIGATGAYLITDKIVSAVKASVALQETEINAKLALAAQGKSAEEIKKIMDAGGGASEAGFFGNIGSLFQYALWGTVLYFGWKIVEPLLKKRRRQNA